MTADQIKLPPHILVVDDEQEIRKIVILYLRDLPSCIIYEAANSFEALEILARHPVDLILADFKMPKVDGLQLLEEAKKNKFNKPFIFISAFDEEELVKKALLKGAYGFISKPIDRKSFLRLVQEALFLSIAV